MSLKIVCLFSVIFCVQIISAQFIGPYGEAACLGGPRGPLAAEWLLSTGALAPSSGGGFAVTSISPLAPTGLSIASENIYDGALSIAGQIPFLSAVSLEGALPTAGVGAITYGCGNGNVAMLSEDIPATYGPYGLGPAGLGPAGLGPAGLAGPLALAGPAVGGCGCGRVGIF